MKLLDIVNGTNYKIVGDVSVDINKIEINSNNVEKNDMFICLVGDNNNGNDFIYDAVKCGATVIVTSEKITKNISGITFVYVEDTRKAYSVFSNNFFNNPNKKLKMIAIVGTNGKTTTSYILKSVLDNAGKKVGVIGTLGIVVRDKKYENNLTTPDSFTLNKYLDLMVKNNVEYVIVEVSAHSIFYNKTYGIVFDYAIFTNFSEDHLDFFNNMYNYCYTKLSFFNTNNVKLAVINSDDFLGKVMLTGNIKLLDNQYQKSYYISKQFFSRSDFLEISHKFKNLQKISYGIDNPSDVFAIDISYDKSTTFLVNAFDKIFEVKSKLLGKYNVYNLLSAITLLEVMGIKESNIIKGIEALDFVEGRLNFISYFDKNIVIDFAHTEDGLKNLLLTTRSLAKGKLIVLFGCGGNRDKLKRAKMGEVASMLADMIILTSDNPRYEQPREIIKDIEKGINSNYTVIIDRFDAIKYGIGILKENDLLVIAGKGGETTQEINGIFYPFCDKDIVNKILRINK